MKIHHDVYLSPLWTGAYARSLLLALIRQITNLTYVVQKDATPPKGPEHAAWKRQLLELLQASLTRAKYEKDRIGPVVACRSDQVSHPGNRQPVFES